ncbi:MAG: hypothetical protein H6622_15285 [Halobacteriovoraceae bacterium]|nr:hypothetical protein [Halobacteriovoraceae bacterium]
MNKKLLLIFLLFSQNSYSLNYNKNGILTVSTSFIAKEVCSCYFVEKNDLKYCQQKYKEDFSILRKMNLKDNSITISYLGIISKSTALFRKNEIGCVLL